MPNKFVILGPEDQDQVPLPVKHLQKFHYKIIERRDVVQLKKNVDF